jgi:hypothetical protein
MSVVTAGVPTWNGARSIDDTVSTVGTESLRHRGRDGGATQPTPAQARV